jgi:hypothetical protein
MWVVQFVGREIRISEGGSDDVGKIGLWTNECGKEALKEIERNFGVYYNLGTDQLENRYRF